MPQCAAWGGAVWERKE